MYTSNIAPDQLADNSKQMQSGAVNILGIETSCDETAVAVVADGRLVRSNVISSSQTEFSGLGGVIPEVAARRQTEYIHECINLALKQAGCSWSDIAAIAVTAGPGLFGSLLVGTTTARLLASLRQKPLLPVHHILGHLQSTWLTDDPATDVPQYPILTLTVSGGHTDLWYRTAPLEAVCIAHTRDDAAGEAFDKAAALLRLPYPGGPSVSRAAADGVIGRYALPIALQNDDTLDFSFSGLKTALRLLVESEPDAATADIAAAFEDAVCRQLLDRVERAAQQYDCREIHLVGGVSANRTLRQRATELFKQQTVRFPGEIAYCTDNGAMIAAAGYEIMQHAKTGSTIATDSSLDLSDYLAQQV